MDYAHQAFMLEVLSSVDSIMDDAIQGVMLELFSEVLSPVYPIMGDTLQAVMLQ
jgi:hypothetical protein